MSVSVLSPAPPAAPPAPAQPPDHAGTTRCPLLVPGRATALGGGSAPIPGTTTWCQPPLWGPSSVPPLPEGMRHGEAPLQADALAHQDLPEENGGTAGGCRRRSPRRAVSGGQHRPLPSPELRDPRSGGEAALPPVRSRKRAAAPGKFPSPSRPAPGKLNKCLAPAAAQGAGPPPVCPEGRARGPSLARSHRPPSGTRRQLPLKGQPKGAVHGQHGKGSREELRDVGGWRGCVLVTLGDGAERGGAWTECGCDRVTPKVTAECGSSLDRQDQRTPKCHRRSQLSVEEPGHTVWLVTRCH